MGSTKVEVMEPCDTHLAHLVLFAALGARRGLVTSDLLVIPAWQVYNAYTAQYEPLSIASGVQDAITLGDFGIPLLVGSLLSNHVRSRKNGPRQRHGFNTMLTAYTWRPLSCNGPNSRSSSIRTSNGLRNSAIISSLLLSDAQRYTRNAELATQCRCSKCNRTVFACRAYQSLVCLGLHEPQFVMLIATGSHVALSRSWWALRNVAKVKDHGAMQIPISPSQCTSLCRR